MGLSKQAIADLDAAKLEMLATDLELQATKALAKAPQAIGRLLAGINATREPLTLTLDLSVIGGGDFTEMITDGATPREFARMPFQSENGKVTLTIAPLGGMVAL